MKIKEDEESTRKVRETTSALKNKIRLASPGGNHLRLTSISSFNLQSASKQNSPLRKLNLNSDLPQTDRSLNQIVNDNPKNQKRKTQISSSSSSKSAKSDHSLEQTSKELQQLKAQLKKINSQEPDVKKESQSRNSSRQHSRTNSALSQQSRKRGDHILKTSQNSSKQRRQSLTLSQRSLSSSTRKKQPLNLLPPFDLSNAYEQQKQNFDQALKYKHLKEKCQRLTHDLAQANVQLREERKKNQQLSQFCVKLKKQRDHYKSNNLSCDSNSADERSPLNEEVASLRDAFNKSESIREQQMNIIRQLRQQVEDQDKRLRMMEHQQQISVLDMQQQELEVIKGKPVKSGVKKTVKSEKENDKRVVNQSKVKTKYV